MIDISELLAVFSQVPLTTLVPAWFYVFSGIVYMLAAVISFLVSYFAFRFFRITSSRQQSILSVSFLLIGIAFTAISAASFITYQNAGSMISNFFALNENAFNYYYILSSIAYLLLVMINVPDRDEKKLFQFVPFVPLWFISSPQFHIIAIAFLTYVAAKNVFNFFKVRSQESFLVMFAFLMILLFHVFLFLIPFGIELYLVAHAFLIAGFLALLTMLIRVTRK